MNHSGMRLRNYVNVDQLYAFHYFELAKDYMFLGESHNFWELFYVDKGEVLVHVDDVPYELMQGDMMLYKPNAYHRLSVSKGAASNLFDIAFDCASDALEHLANRQLRLNDSERELLVQIVKEGFLAFAPPYHDPAVHHIHRREDALGDSEQLLRSYLEILLIRLIRRAPAGQESEEELPFVSKEKRERDMVQSVTAYLRDRLHQPLSLDDVCESFNVGRTQMTRLFKKRTGYPMIEYYKRLKVEQAKLLVREERHNFTEIARLMGYSSIHHFSKAFKKYGGMTPSEYAKSIQARTEERSKPADEAPASWPDTLSFSAGIVNQRNP